MEERFLRLPEVLNMIGIGKTKFYDLIKQGKAPNPCKPSSRVSLWKKSDIISFMDSISNGELYF